MKLRHILPLLVIIILMSSIVSAGFFGDLLSIITGKAISKDGFYIEYESNFDLSKSATCNGIEKTFIIKSYGDDLIEIDGTSTKEVYITNGPCKGIYYLNQDTNMVTSLRSQATDLVIGNRYYRFSLKSPVDLSPLLGAAYTRIETPTLTSDSGERTMKLDSATSKTKLIYMYEHGAKSHIIYEDSSGTLREAATLAEPIEFDASPTLVPKKVAEKPAVTAVEEEKAAETATVSEWDEERVAALEAEMGTLSAKIDELTVSVNALCEEEEKGFWRKLFKG